ncbi:clostripain-related cysteine peptidase [Bradyrhizobium tropiciagri]|uniref:clostripain-related cysteine peptidase n=1 Tax=Bradyrhizobium tropiciagri TaxID=312253 RepID=UPI00067B8D0B|nr:clostripain-related cysteine peptidase [Bradyrhizobium tropiciagri]
MVRSLVYFIVFIVSTTGFLATQAKATPAEWTVMIFMNAKNNLEPDAIENFNEIASRGSTPDVNVVVEMGRPAVNITEAAEKWSGVLRFYVRQNQEPVPSQAVVDLRGKPELSDLGSPRALQDFVDWAVETYPAKRYMLVIWNHGQGWRFQLAGDADVRAASASRNQAVPAMPAAALQKAAENTPPLGGFRAVSFDQDTGNFLFNSDIQSVTEVLSSRLSRPIDVIGFDACLMSMLETAYAFQNSSSVLLASEELEPGAGWDYDYFLKRLSAKPSATGLELSQMVVDGYRARYGDSHSTTLSVLDLSKANATAAAISKFADVLLAKYDTEKSNVAQARAGMKTYGSGAGLKTSVDLIGFAQRYAAITNDEAAKTAAQAVAASASESVLYNYASARSKRDTMSNGVAIYFPASNADFEADPYHDGYLKENTAHVVDFVSKERWADFLKHNLQ